MASDKDVSSETTVHHKVTEPDGEVRAECACGCSGSVSVTVYVSRDGQDEPEIIMLKQG